MGPTTTSWSPKRSRGQKRLSGLSGLRGVARAPGVARIRIRPQIAEAMASPRVLCVLALLVAACATAPKRSAFRARPPQIEVPTLEPAFRTARPRGTCVAETAEASLAVEDVNHGAALVFTTSEDVRELRQRVIALPPSPTIRLHRARSDNIPRGVRLVFEAAPGEIVESLRRALRARAKELAEQCAFTFGLRAERVAEIPTPPPAEKRSTPAPEPIEAPPTKTENDAAKPEPAKPEAVDGGTSTPGPAPDAEPEKPPESGKPKKGDKPKDDDKPRYPFHRLTIRVFNAERWAWFRRGCAACAVSAAAIPFGLKVALDILVFGTLESARVQHELGDQPSMSGTGVRASSNEIRVAPDFLWESDRTGRHDISIDEQGSGPRRCVQYRE